MVHPMAERKEYSVWFCLLISKLLWQAFTGLITKLNVAHCYTFSILRWLKLFFEIESRLFANKNPCLSIVPSLNMHIEEGDRKYRVKSFHIHKFRTIRDLNQSLLWFSGSKGIELTRL